jgi:hypothetical protein
MEEASRCKLALLTGAELLAVWTVSTPPHSVSLNTVSHGFLSLAQYW